MIFVEKLFCSTGDIEISKFSLFLQKAILLNWWNQNILIFLQKLFHFMGDIEILQFSLSCKKLFCLTGEIFRFFLFFAKSYSSYWMRLEYYNFLSFSKKAIPPHRWNQNILKFLVFYKNLFLLTDEIEIFLWKVILLNGWNWSNLIFSEKSYIT